MEQDSGTGEDETDLPEELAAKLQLWEAACRHTDIVKDAAYVEMLDHVRALKEAGKLDTLGNGLSLAMQNLTSLLEIQVPMHPVGDLTSEAIVELHVRAAEMQTSNEYRELLDHELMRLNAISIQQGRGPLPGCELLNEAYWCAIDENAPAHTYPQSALNNNARLRESQNILQDQYNQANFDYADQLLVQEALNGTVAIPRVQEAELCKIHAVLTETGVLPELEAANVRFEEASEISDAKATMASLANGHEGRGHMLYVHDNTLKLVFTGNSEAKYPEWKSVAEAYNMKNTPKEALQFTREADGGYIAKGDTEALQAFATHMHRGLTSLQQTPEMSLPQMAAHEQATSRER